MLEYRTVLDALAQLGISEDQIDDFEKDYADFIQKYQDITQQKQDFLSGYKELLRLKSQVMHASSQSFIFGPLYREDDMTIEETESNDTHQDQAKESDKYSHSYIGDILNKNLESEIGSK